MKKGFFHGKTFSMKLRIFSALFLLLLFSRSVLAEEVDCSEAYPKKLQPEGCVIIACDEKYDDFIGTWTGPFEAFVDEFSVYDRNPNDGVAIREMYSFRPYLNSITYSPTDCLKNVRNGDVFIIGRRTDTYPQFTGINFRTGQVETLTAKTKVGLLITGRNADGIPFLRTIDDDFGPINYQRIEEDQSQNLSVWKSTNFSYGTLIIRDGEDPADKTNHKRNVTVTFQYAAWEGDITRGFHAKSQY